MVEHNYIYGHKGLCITRFGPFKDPREQVEHCATIVKEKYEANRCWWDKRYVYFYVKELIPG